VSSFRAPVERTVATLKTWRILFTDYRPPVKAFMSSFRAAIGALLLQGQSCITPQDLHAIYTASTRELQRLASRLYLAMT
jgi:hypothetical protein